MDRRAGLAVRADRLRRGLIRRRHRQPRTSDLRVRLRSERSRWWLAAKQLPDANGYWLGLAAIFLLGGHPFPRGTLAFGCFFLAALFHEWRADRAVVAR
jgi:hypothetical protein